MILILETEHIKHIIADYFRDKPVREVWLFGSYARGDADEESDIDVLVNFEEKSNIGLRYLTWNEEIEALTKKKVQVVSDKGLSKFIRSFIEADKVLMYEK